MRLLTIDPSLTCTGYAVWMIHGTWEDHKHNLDSYGCFKTFPNDEILGRLYDLSRKIKELLTDNNISLVVYERPRGKTIKGSWAQNDKYKAAVNSVTGTVMDYFFGVRKHLIGVNVETWKGSGKKKDTLNKVNMFFGLDLKVKDNDIADAIGLGMWFLKRQQINPIDYTFTG